MTVLTRKSHVKRCFGVTKNPDGGLDDDFDSYLDILRTDELKYTTSDGQDYRFIIKWSDDTLKEDADDYDNVAQIEGRKTELGKGTDPELPFKKDPDSYVPFRVINQIIISDSGIGQKVKYKFKNKNTTDEGAQIPTSRKIDIIRLYHYGTTVDDVLNDETGKHIVTDEEYARLDDSTKDETQYADMEVIRDWTHIAHSTVDGQNIDGQDIKMVLKNKELYLAILGIEIDNEISPGTNSSGEPTIPGRMDPFQTVLNAQWNSAAKFYDKAT